MDTIEAHVRERGDAAALVGERVLTWRELDRRANRVARALAARGIGAGDRVAVGLRNSIEYFELIGAAGRLGATVLPLSFRLKRDEIEYLVSDTGASVIVAEPANASELV